MTTERTRARATFAETGSADVALRAFHFAESRLSKSSDLKFSEKKFSFFEEAFKSEERQAEGEARKLARGKQRGTLRTGHQAKARRVCTGTSGGGLSTTTRTDRRGPTPSFCNCPKISLVLNETS